MENPGARKGPLWTPAEDAVVLELAPRFEAKDIAQHLPGRTELGVFHRMRRLGINKRRRWTAADDTKLGMLWGEPIRTVAKELGRSIITVYWRAQKLGLPLGVPEGGERLSNAAARCGFATETFRAILGWAGVPIRRALTREALKHRRGTHWVESDLADQAVERWCKTETIHAAAMRLGVGDAFLLNRLMASGLRLPAKPGGKRHWRIPSATIDRAVAMVVRRGKRLEVRKEAA